MAERVHIAVGIDHLGWHTKFAEALDQKIQQGAPIDYRVLNLEAHDWLSQIQPYDAVIWNPSYMGPKSAKYIREKITIIEKFLGKVALPNLASIWHFESKIAQSYLFALAGVKTPATTVSFEWHDAMEQLEHAAMPIVWKISHGAGSRNVHLIRSRNEAERQISKVFCQQIWSEAKQRSHSRASLYAHSIWHPWFWEKIRQKIAGSERYGYAYWQEFIPGNTADLRITIIGDRFAFGFWRDNRPGDFRASGSGRIDYQRAVPEAAIRYCMSISRQHDFDSMCYDVLFAPDGVVLTEMSYNYLDNAIHRTHGYYELGPGDELLFREESVWPQTLWVEWALHRLGREDRVLTMN